MPCVREMRKKRYEAGDKVRQSASHAALILLKERHPEEFQALFADVLKALGESDSERGTSPDTDPSVAPSRRRR